MATKSDLSVEYRKPYTGVILGVRGNKVISVEYEKSCCEYFLSGLKYEWPVFKETNRLRKGGNYKDVDSCFAPIYCCVEQNYNIYRELCSRDTFKNIMKSSASLHGDKTWHQPHRHVELIGSMTPAHSDACFHIHEDLIKRENIEKYIFVWSHELAHFLICDHIPQKLSFDKHKVGNHRKDPSYVALCLRIEIEADICALLLYFALTGKEASGFHRSIGELPPDDATGIKLSRILNNKDCTSFFYKWYKSNLAKHIGQ